MASDSDQPLCSSQVYKVVVRWTNEAETVIYRKYSLFFDFVVSVLYTFVPVLYYCVQWSPSGRTYVILVQQACFYLVCCTRLRPFGLFIQMHPAYKVYDMALLDCTRFYIRAPHHI